MATVRHILSFSLYHKHVSIHTGTLSLPYAWFVCLALTGQSNPFDIKVANALNKFIKENALTQGISPNYQYMSKNRMTA